MKRFLILAILLFVSVSLTDARMNVGVVGGGGGAAAVCASYLSNTTHDNSITQGGTGETYAGQVDYIPSGNHTICQIDYYVHSVTGNVSAKVHNMYIFTLTGNDLNTQVGKSDDKTGVAVGSNTFTFTTKPTLTNGTQYAIVIGSAEDASNKIAIDIKGGSTTFGNIVGNWTSAGVKVSSYSGYTETMVLYE